MCDFTTINPLSPTAKFQIPKHLKLHWYLHLFTTVGLPPVASLTSNSCYCVILNNSKRTQNVFEINYKNVIHKITHKKKTETSSHLLQHPSRFITSRLGSRVILFWRIYRELRNVWQTHLPTICDANNIHTHTHRFTSSLQLGDPRCTLLEKLYGIVRRIRAMRIIDWMQNEQYFAKVCSDGRNSIGLSHRSPVNTWITLYTLFGWPVVYIYIFKWNSGISGH